MRVKGILPAFVAYDTTIEFRGGRLEYIDSKNEIRIRLGLELGRVKKET